MLKELLKRALQIAWRLFLLTIIAGLTIAIATLTEINNGLKKLT